MERLGLKLFGLFIFIFAWAHVDGCNYKMKEGNMEPVIIVGGGPVGLSTAVSLAYQGIPSIVIEKHPTITNHPKARGINGRSMELFRLWGLEESLRQYELPKEAYRFTWMEDFQGKEIIQIPATVDYSAYSPTKPSVVSQDSVEEELLKKAQSFPIIDVRFSTEMLSASQDENQVRVEILHRKTGQTENLTAPYLIAADGANSPLRKLFNVEMEGIDNLGVFCNIYCEVDLSKYVADRLSVNFMFTRPDVRGAFFAAKDGRKKWLIGTRLNPEVGLTQERFTDDFCVEYVKNVINDPEIEVKLINKVFWTMAALIAKEYRVGRVFFAGDAAHRIPPTGGYGMNTGIQDAHNLAWKLAMVMKGQAKDNLLDSYFTERVQIAKTNTAWSTRNAGRFTTIFTALAKEDFPAFKAALKDQTHHINNILLDLGFVYGKEYQNQSEYHPSAEVGARAPHCWLSQGEKQVSTLDLYDKQFVLVCAPQARYWQEQYKDFPCRIATIGKGGEYIDSNEDFLETYGISNEGAVLVRPDGHVAWHQKDAHGEKAHFDWFLEG